MGGPPTCSQVSRSALQSRFVPSAPGLCGAVQAPTIPRVPRPLQASIIITTPDWENQVRENQFNEYQFCEHQLCKRAICTPAANYFTLPELS